METTTDFVWSKSKGDYMRRETCTAGEARKFLADPKVVAQVSDKPAKLNKNLTKRQAYDIMVKGIADDPDDKKLHPVIYKNIIREFG